MSSKNIKIFEVEGGNMKEIPMPVFKSMIQRELMKEHESKLRQLQEIASNLLVETFGEEQKNPLTELVNAYQNYINTTNKFTKKEMTSQIKKVCPGFNKSSYYYQTKRMIEINLKNGIIKEIVPYDEKKNAYYMKAN